MRTKAKGRMGMRYGRDWTDTELKRLRAYAKTVTSKVAAERLGRSWGAVRLRASAEGISFRQVRGRATA